MKKYTLALLAALMVAFIPSCYNDARHKSSDTLDKERQEVILKEGSQMVGMPSVKNFRRKKLLKDIIEMCDQMDLNTYTYIVAENTGKLIFIGESLGFGIPASTQFTNPQKIESCARYGGGYEYEVMAQADPDGLFSPASSDGTWVMMKDPKTHNVKPMYIEPRVIVSQWRLDEQGAAEKKVTETPTDVPKRGPHDAVAKSE